MKVAAVRGDLSCDNLMCALEGLCDSYGKTFRRSYLDDLNTRPALLATYLRELAAQMPEEPVA